MYQTGLGTKEENGKIANNKNQLSAFKVTNVVQLG